MLIAFSVRFQMIASSLFVARHFVSPARSHAAVLARALSSFADPVATRRRAAQFGWPLTATLRRPHLISSGGSGADDGLLVVGRVGFGSPPLGAAATRAASLRAALAGGCNWVELDAPLAANDPRLLSLGDPYGDQFLCVCKAATTSPASLPARGSLACWFIFIGCYVYSGVS